MYKLLIVDDEPMIRKGLRTIIDWEQYNFTVVGEAANGREALNKHGSLKPDLFLMDIRMPGMDGIQTIEEIRRTDKQCRFLILSGYADFGYAKQAIAFGVDGYILKPVDEAELEEYAKRIAESLGKEAERTEMRSGETRVDVLLEELVRGAEPESEHGRQLSQLNELLGSQTAGCRLLLIEWSRGAELPTSLFAAARRRLQDIVEAESAGWVFAAEPFTALLVKDAAVQEAQLLEWIRQSAGKNSKFIALASGYDHAAADIVSSYEALREVMKASFKLEDGRLHLASDPEVAAAASANGERHEAPPIEVLSKQIHDVIDAGNEEAVPRILQEIGDALWQATPSEQSVKTAFAQLLTLLLNRLSDHYKELSLQSELAMITELYKQTNYDEMLGQLASRMTDIIRRLGNSSDVPIIKRITGYIERNYSHNLKLETLAEQFNYNSGYLGKMFKAHTGENFNTYLDQVRMRHAVELLQQGYKVHQVSDMVGYANVDYFHAKFKKYKGVSPSYYKIK